MRKIHYSLVCLAILVVSACQKGPYPYITLKQVKEIDSIVHPAIKNAAFIYKNNIYFVTDFTKNPVQITTDGSAAKFVKISHDHSKFAYLNTGNRIEIVGNNGAVVTTLSQYTQVKCFDWSPDDKTLYILNGNSMVYYGPSMNLPAFNYPNGSEQEAISASVSMQGDFAYVVQWFDFFNGYQYELIIQPHDNGNQIVYSNNENAYQMDYVSFSDNDQDMVVGYKNLNDYGSDVQQNIDVFTGLKSYPDFSYGATCTPLYNSAINYIVAGRNTDDNSTNVPAALYMGTNDSEFANANVAQNIFLTNYGSASANVYTDWK